MKKTLSVIMAVIMMTTVISVGLTAFAQEHPLTNTDIKWSYDETTKVLTFSGRGEIPSDGKTLNSSGEPALIFAWHNCQFESVVIDENITGIGDYTFYGCQNLKSIKLSNKINYLGKGVFSKCTNIETVEMSANIAEIKENTFSDCNKLSNITLPDGLKKIGSEAFKKCSSLAEINLPDSVTEIGNKAFAQCVKLKNFTAPISLEKISSFAFSSCDGLETISLNDSLKSIESSCFKLCKSLKEITLPINITVIPSDAFYKCSALSKAVFLGNVTEIQNNAFFGCTALKSITLPESIEKIGTGSLGYEKATVTVTDFEIFGFNNTVAESYASENKFAFNSIGVHYSGSCGESTSWEYDPENKVLTFSGSGDMINFTEETLPYYNKNFEVSKIVIGDEITSIGDYAFFNMNLAELDLSSCEKLTKIGKNAINFVTENTDDEAEIFVPTNIESIGENGITLYDSEMNKLENFAITGYKYSCAYNYAKANEITFKQVAVDTMSGKCGEEITWEIDKTTGVLSLTGTGAMYDYKLTSLPVFAFLSNEIKSIEIDKNIIYIGNFAFFGLDTGSVTISSFDTEIGEKSIGYTADENDEVIKIPSFVINGIDGSKADKYALNNEIEFSQIGASENEEKIEGKCGESATWSYDKATQILTVSGTGKIFGYELENLPDYSKLSVNKVIIGEEITDIGNNAFILKDAACTFDLPKSLKSIGEKAIGYLNNETFSINTAAVIEGYENTEAQKYATENGIDFSAKPDEKPLVDFSNSELHCIVDESAGTITLYGTEVKKDQFIALLAVQPNVTIEISNDLIGTGTTLTIKKGEKEEQSFVFICKGDTNGDSKLTSQDALEILQHCVEDKILEGNQFNAGDVDSDNRITSSDALNVLMVAVGEKQATDYQPK